MFRFWVVGSVAICFLSFSARGIAQPDRQDVDALRASIQALQSRLDELSTDDSSNRRVANLGKQPPPPPVQPVEDNALVLRYYDLSDVFGVAPKYPARWPKDFERTDEWTFAASQGTLASGFGGGAFSIPSDAVIDSPNFPSWSPPQDVSPAASVTIDSLVKVIQTVITPEEWAKNHWTIAELSMGLLVNAPESTQHQIEGMLDLFRRQWGSLRTVFVQAFWIRSDLGQIHELLRAPETTSLQAEKGVGAVAGPRWEEFFKGAVAEKRIPYAAFVALHNGQTINTCSGQRPIYISRMTPKATQAAGGKPGETVSILTFDVERTQIQLGSTLQLTAAVTRGGNYVVLDVHNRINELVNGGVVAKENLSSIPDAATTTDPAEVVNLLDRPNYSTYELSTTVRCPRDEIVLVGGAESIGEKSDNGSHLFMFVKTSVYNVVLDDNVQAISPTPRKASH